MTTLLMETLLAGDVLEIRTKATNDDVMTVLVLLATENFVILDPCDDSTPFVLQAEELVEYRKFDADEF
ncbi:MAG: hypothetical protein AB8G14_03925 [Ilumatobacter sp.]